MENIPPVHATNALQILADAALEKRQEVDDFQSDPLREDSDEEVFSPSPIFDSYQNGPQTILEMTNFTVREFLQLWSDIEEHVSKNWGCGRGKRSSFSAKDVFFMALTVLKHGGQWDFLGKIFLIKGPTFEKMIMKFIRAVAEHAYTTFVVNLLDMYPMHKVLKSPNSAFRHFKFARYATDVTFQQTNRPSGNIEEAKRYFSGKHKLYGYKVEVSVLPFGVAICCSGYYPGSVSDLEILRKMKEYHEIMLQKKEDDLSITDVGHLSDEYADLFPLLVDKGYQGAGEFLRAIHPKKSPPVVFLPCRKKERIGRCQVIG